MWQLYRLICMPSRVIAIRASGVRAWWTVMSGSSWPLMDTMLWVISPAGMTCVAAADLVMVVLRSWDGWFAPFSAGVSPAGGVAVSTP